MTMICNAAPEDTAHAGERLARQITAEREARGWSQAALAARSGVSKAAVSRIERGEMSPTALTLLRLASALDLTLAGLLTRAEGGGERLSRADTQPEWRDPQTGYVRRQLFAAPQYPLEAARITLPPGAQLTLPAESYRHIQQLVWMHSGTLRLTEHRAPDQTFDLHAGDCLAFGPPCDVTFHNAEPDPCTYAVLLARR